MKNINLKKYGAFYVMLCLPVLLTFVYHYIPLFGVSIAFLDYKPALGFKKAEFVGLDNFLELFSKPDFLLTIKNTVIIAFWKTVTGLVVPIVFSLLLNELRNNVHKRIAQTVVYLPHFVSWILVSGIIIEVLSPTGGIVNQILEMFGAEPIFFLGQPEMFKPILIITNVWKSFGWGTIIYMAALTGIDMNLYEAAAIDGAGRWKQTLHITLPGISSTIVLQLILSMDNILNAGFDQVFNLMNSLVKSSGDIIDTYVYRLGLGSAEFSLSTSAGLFKSLVGGTLMIISYKLAHKITGYRPF